MDVNIDEALRYLGVRTDADGSLRAHLSALAQQLQARLTPRFTWALAEVSALALPGRTAERMLADCDTAAVLVCTLGADFDRWIRQLQVRDMTSAVMLDALGSAYVEAGCDAAEEAIRTRFPGKFLTDRFSPGYGDLPLTVQPRLMQLTGSARLGVTLTDSLLMNPQKSVTAVVGLADQPQKARIRGCDFCAMRANCTLRKAGTPCHV